MNTPYSKRLSEPTLEGATSEFAHTLETAPMDLLELSDASANEPRAPGKWSRKETLGHLMDSALNNHQRFVRAQVPAHLENGVLRLPGYAQDDWVRVGAYRTRPWTDLVQLWSLLNRQVLHVIKHAEPSSLQTPCVIGGGDPITLEAVMIDYVGHLKHHLKQILE